MKIRRSIDMGPDEICETYADKKGKKRITVQTYKEEDRDMVLIEGEAKALEFLGNLLLAQAKFEKDCAFSIGPRTAGFGFFTKNSTHGIFIHRLPCLEKKGLKLEKNSHHFTQ